MSYPIVDIILFQLDQWAHFAAFMLFVDVWTTPAADLGHSFSVPGAVFSFKAGL